MAHEDIHERTGRMEEQMNGDRTTFREFREEMRTRMDNQDKMLESLMDDLKLRRWLARLVKSTILVIVAILGVIHAPHWVHQLLGIEDVNQK